MTDECVESTVRDAADRGYIVTLVEDACAATTAERHAASIDNMKVMLPLNTSQHRMRVKLICELELCEDLHNR